MKKTYLLIFMVAAVVLLTSYATAFGQAAAAAPEEILSFNTGFLPMIIYLLCFCLIYKGIEIFQIALMRNNENKPIGYLVGIIAIIISVIITIKAFRNVNSLTKEVSKSIHKLWLP
jgi:uncharacterized membrane protein